MKGDTDRSFEGYRNIIITSKHKPEKMPEVEPYKQASNENMSSTLTPAGFQQDKTRCSVH